MTKDELKQVARFCKKFFILLVLLFCCDRLLGTWIENAYNNNPQGDVATFAHSVTNPKEDIFIYGSSRAVHGYDTRIFTDSLGYSCFNSGRENSTILYHNTILQSTIQKHAPKIIILDVSAKELTLSNAENSKNVLASMILPYVRRDTSFANIARNLFPDELRKAEVSKLYAYNSLILPVLLKNKKAEKKNIINGYLPLHGAKVKGKIPSFTDDNDIVDSFARNNFEDFVKTLKERNVRLYVIQSPLFVKPFTTTISLETMKGILKKYDVPFWDYAFDTAFYKRDYFYDNIHLNAKGAEAFSKQVVSDIKSDLKKNDPALLKQ